MNYSFEYIDIILLAMIAGFIFLRLRGIMGKRTGFEGKAPSQFEDVLNNIQAEKKNTQKNTFTLKTYLYTHKTLLFTLNTLPSSKVAQSSLSISFNKRREMGSTFKNSPTISL